jgi:RNA polymerase sigma-70 factor (ECF subfamily)
MAAITQGDEEAFEELQGRWERRLYGFFRRLTGSAEDARDLCQETFIKVFRGSHNYRPAGNFRAWLFRIAENNLFDFCGKRQRERGKTLYHALLPEQNQAGSSLSDDLQELRGGLTEGHRCQVGSLPGIRVDAP